MWLRCDRAWIVPTFPNDRSHFLLRRWLNKQSIIDIYSSQTCKTPLLASCHFLRPPWHANLVSTSSPSRYGKSSASWLHQQNSGRSASAICSDLHGSGSGREAVRLSRSEAGPSRAVSTASKGSTARPQFVQSRARPKGRGFQSGRLVEAQSLLVVATFTSPS